MMTSWAVVRAGLHLRLSWHRLSSDTADLKNALIETQLVKNAELSAAVLSVYIDSCRNLPNARPQSKPDPYLQITVGKKTENTAVQMRTDNPVYEIGHSFLHLGPTHIHDSVSAEAGRPHHGQPAHQPAEEEDYEEDDKPPTPTVVTPPAPAAPEKVIPAPETVTVAPAAPETTDGATAPIVGTVEPDAKNLNGNPEKISEKPVPVEQIIKQVDRLVKQAWVAFYYHYAIVCRTKLYTSSNIPLKDPTNVPDPYVKLYLLPGRSKDSKRKTLDSCNPEYDDQFEWVIPLAELHSRHIEVTVATHKGFLGGSPVIGQVFIHLNQYDFREATTMWFDLMPETSPRD
ncbi:unnamed protein product [Leptidea sinapis]|uniref:C2 domain-containing protein n=1 Tax=Leptidea sinapis TaxID=189913 RepID=A0A5E4QJ98_9NEOP|nr:unnamed protein product [Leptidea sinapis]